MITLLAKYSLTTMQLSQNFKYYKNITEKYKIPIYLKIQKQLMAHRKS